MELLELDRGILANLQLEVRSDILILAASHPDLAQKFQDLRDRLDTPLQIFEPSAADCSITSDSTSLLDSSKSIAEHHALTKRFDDLLHHIRSLPEFQNFLQGPTESELRSWAGEGPIVGSVDFNGRVTPAYTL